MNSNDNLAELNVMLWTLRIAELVCTITIVYD